MAFSFCLVDFSVLFHLSQFFFSHLFGTLLKLPDVIATPVILSTKLDEVCLSSSSSSPSECLFEVEIEKGLIERFNNQYSQMKTYLKKKSEENPPIFLSFSFRTIQTIFFSLRLLCLVVAFSGNLFSLFILSSLQFIILPYSLFVSFAALIVWTPVLFLPHYLSLILYHLTSSLLLSSLPPSTSEILSPLFEFYVQITPSFIVIFFLVDQAICIFMMFQTEYGKVQLPPNILSHVFYGFINSKSYHVLLLLYLSSQNYQIFLLPWAIQFIFSAIVFYSIEKRLDYTPFFYLQHRLGHLPSVYTHGGHKFHHNLHDTASFDAHFFGSGAPEEFFALMFEIFATTYLSLSPLSLSALMAIGEWLNKVGHVRTKNPVGSENHHPDHHTIHNKNFASEVLDLLFGTNYPQKEQTKLLNGFSAVKRVKGENIILSFYPPNHKKE